MLLRVSQCPLASISRLASLSRLRNRCKRWCRVDAPGLSHAWPAHKLDDVIQAATDCTLCQCEKQFHGSPGHTNRDVPATKPWYKVGDRHSSLIHARLQMGCSNLNSLQSDTVIFRVAPQIALSCPALPKLSTLLFTICLHIKVRRPQERPASQCTDASRRRWQPWKIRGPKTPGTACQPVHCMSPCSVFSPAHTRS